MLLLLIKRDVRNGWLHCRFSLWSGVLFEPQIALPNYGDWVGWKMGPGLVGLCFPAQDSGVGALGFVGHIVYGYFIHHKYEK